MIYIIANFLNNFNQFYQNFGKFLYKFPKVMLKFSEIHYKFTIMQTLPLNSTTNLDQTDKKLLHHLTKNARLSIGELAELVNLSATPTARRIKRLEELGLITGYHAHTSPEKLGYTLSVFVAVSMDKHTDERFGEFESQIKSFDEVVSCSLVTGRSEDYLLKVLVRDMAHYEEFLLRRLSKIEGVSQLHTSFELREVFSRSVV